MALRYLRDMSGIQTPQVTSFPINAATNIAKGVAGTLNSSTGYIEAITNASTAANPIAGVTAASHNAVNSTLSPWEVATEIRMYSSPGAVFAAPCPTVTAAAGSTNAVINAAGTLGAFADNAFIGGWAQLKTLDATNGTCTDPIGTKKFITDSANSTTLINAAFTNAAAVGDVFYIYPPVGFLIEVATGTTPSLAACTSNAPLKVVGWDFDTHEIHLMAAQHPFGNDVD